MSVLCEVMSEKMSHSLYTIDNTALQLLIFLWTFQRICCLFRGSLFCMSTVTSHFL